jgi:glycosyltransferase involved in cell wall biosynthesis
MFRGVPATVILNARSMPTMTNAAPSGRERARTFGYLGSLTPHKGIEFLVRAFRNIPQKSVTLIVAGSGDPRYVEHLKRLADPVRVRFIGQVQPEGFFPMVDALIVPSLCPEALSLAAVEACQAGIPVIASSRGGIPEVIQDGHNGLLFDPEKQEALITCMQRMIDDSSLFQKLAKNASTSATRFSDIENWLTQYEDVLNHAISARLPAEPETSRPYAS